MTSTDAAPAADGVVSLADAFAVVRHRWRPIVACLLLGVLAAVAAYSVTPPSYVATATVQVYPLPTDLSTPSVSQKDISMPTEVGVVTTASVATQAAEKIGWTGSTADLLKQVSVSSPTDSLLLDITYTAGTAQAAAAGANAFANAYLAQRGASAKAAADAVLASINKQVAALQKTINGLDARIAKLPATSDVRAALVRQRDSAQSQMQSLNAIASNVELLRLTPGALVGPAEVPTSKAAPRAIIYLAGGALLGLLVGLTIAAARHRGDPRIRRFDNLEKVTGLPVLGRITTHSGSPIGPHGVTTPDEIRQLAVRMVASVGTSTPLIYLISSSGQHGAHIPSQVAEALATSGSRVGLAVTDMEPIPVGLERSGVSVVPLGPEAQLLHHLRDVTPMPEVSTERLEVVIVDGVNLDLASSAIALAHVSTAVALVVAESRTRRDALHSEINEMRRSRAQLAGLIVVARRRRVFRRHGPTRGVRRLADRPTVPSSYSPGGSSTLAEPAGPPGSLLGGRGVEHAQSTSTRHRR